MVGHNEAQRLVYGLATLIIFSSSYFTMTFQKMPVKYLLVSIVVA
jgi:hypothetical protein